MASEIPVTPPQPTETLNPESGVQNVSALRRTRERRALRMDPDKRQGIAERVVRFYNADNAACEQATRLDANGELDPSSASFDAYRDCMIEHGYTLRTY